MDKGSTGRPDQLRRVPYADQLLGMGIRQRLEQHALNHREDHRVRANAHGQRDERDGRKHGSAAEAAQNLLESIDEHGHGNPPGMSAIAPELWQDRSCARSLWCLLRYQTASCSGIAEGARFSSAQPGGDIGRVFGRRLYSWGD